MSDAENIAVGKSYVDALKNGEMEKWRKLGSFWRMM